MSFRTPRTSRAFERVSDDEESVVTTSSFASADLPEHSSLARDGVSLKPADIDADTFGMTVVALARDSYFLARHTKDAQHEVIFYCTQGVQEHYGYPPLVGDGAQGGTAQALARWKSDFLQFYFFCE